MGKLKRSFLRLAGWLRFASLAAEALLLLTSLFFLAELIRPGLLAGWVNVPLLALFSISLAVASPWLASLAEPRSTPQAGRLWLITFTLAMIVAVAVGGGGLTRAIAALATLGVVIWLILTRGSND